MSVGGYAGSTGTNPRAPDRQRGQKEASFPVTQWRGMMSALPVSTVPMDAWSSLLNMDFQSPYRVSSRMGTELYMNNVVTGSSGIVAGYEYKPTGALSSKIVFMTANGKLYQMTASSGSTPSLIGSLDNSSIKMANIVMLKDKLYFGDGVSGYSWDGTTLTNINSNFPSGPDAANKLYVEKMLNRTWWLTDDDYLTWSVVNDPDDLTTTANGAGKIQIDKEDGTMGLSLIKWGKRLLVNKGDETLHSYLMYLISGIGTTADPFVVDPLFGDLKTPVAFLGRSGIELGNDVLGITFDGINTVSAINNFQESSISPISLVINDFISRINFTAQHKIVSVYDIILKQYLCAAPLDGSGSNTHVLVYDRLWDRWSIYDNWPVRCWLRVGTDLLYGNENGEWVKTRTGHNDRDAAYSKVAEGGNLDFGAPDIIKLFKNVSVSLLHEAQYNVNFKAIVDDFESDETTIALKMSATTNIWDVFVWDDDTWDLEGSTIHTPAIQKRGKNLRLRFYNENADEPFSIESLVYRMVSKDSGPLKTS